MPHKDTFLDWPAWKRWAWHQQQRAKDFGMSANYIVRVIESPCEDKWRVLVETALPAAGDSMFMLITPQPDEMLEEYLEPKGRRGASRRKPRHGPRWRNTRSGTRRGWARPRIPYFDGWAAQRLPGRDYFRGRDVGRGEKWFWKGINVADKLLWWWLLIDATDNFVTEWHSGLMHSRFCRRAWDILAACNWSGEVTLGHPLWLPPDINIEQEKNCAFVALGDFNVTEPDRDNAITHIAQASGYAEDAPDIDPNYTDVWFQIDVTYTDGSTETINLEKKQVHPEQEWHLSTELTLVNVRESNWRVQNDRAPEGLASGPVCNMTEIEFDAMGEYDP